MRPIQLALTCAAGLALSAAVSATVVTYNFGLDGLQEVPPVNTTGWGVAEVTLNTQTGLLTWEVEYHDLLSPSTAAHFHGPAPPGQNAGVQVGMAGQFGGTSGTLVGSATINPNQVQQVLDGLWYINIHSQLFPAGEIRGQVVDDVAPCPGDLTGNGVVGVEDLLELLSCWGAVQPGCEDADLTGNDVVGVEDLLVLLANWGPCP